MEGSGSGEGKELTLKDLGLTEKDKEKVVDRAVKDLVDRNNKDIPTPAVPDRPRDGDK